MNATDAERTAVLVATAADVDESPNASAVVPSDSFMARQQEEAAKRAGNVGRYHRIFPLKLYWRIWMRGGKKSR